jgi:hypothetical protein
MMSQSDFGIYVDVRKGIARDWFFQKCAAAAGDFLSEVIKSLTREPARWRGWGDWAMASWARVRISIKSGHFMGWVS